MEAQCGKILTSVFFRVFDSIGTLVYLVKLVKSGVLNNGEMVPNPISPQVGTALTEVEREELRELQEAIEIINIAINYRYCNHGSHGNHMCSNHGYYLGDFIFYSCI